MYRLLHFADLHLDTSFAENRFPGIKARKHRQNLRQALIRILDLALEKKVQAVTIAGDLYEQDRFGRDTGEFLLSQFRRIAPVRVFIAPGNHDPWVAESLYQYLPWPSNVRIFSNDQFEPVHLTDNWTLWGLAHVSPSFRKNPVENVNVSQANSNILLFHGSDISNVPHGKTAHAPFLPDDLEKSGTNLVLLGHYHRGKLQQQGLVTYYYPGSPEPLGFAEDGLHSAGLVTLDQQNCNVEPIEINRCFFKTGEINISGVMSNDELNNKIETWAKKNVAPDDYLKIVLTGDFNPEIDIDLDLLQEKLAEYCETVLLQNNTHAQYDLTLLAAEKTVRGEFVRTMHARMQKADKDEKQRLEQALIYGIKAFEHREILPG